MRRALLALFGTAIPLLACKPDLGERESRITRTQVLAVRGEPPEAKPGETVRYSLLVATPDGPITTPAASWAFCSTPKLLTENGAASATCLGSSEVGVRPIAELASQIEAAVPADACALFGPEITSADLRPRDPDITGGFYQPLRVTVFDRGSAQIAVGLERVACKIANASAQNATEYAKRYVSNANPTLLPVTALQDGRPIALDAIPPGATVTLRASWPAESAESYVVYDLVRRSVVTHRESLRVSWFATAGTFAEDRTGRAEEELETFTDNAWTAPSAPSMTHLFVVLRDARGGATFATYDLLVR